MAPIKLMVNGLPGNMAAILALHAAQDTRFKLLPYSLTGPEITDTHQRIGDQEIRLVRPDQKASLMARIKADSGDFITIDYTHPSAVNANAQFYCDENLPFVMGTTGGEREKLAATVTASAIPAVIAPNMAKQIVGFQAMMAYAAEQFPGLFNGYSLAISESHQNGKADTSGTAKAMVTYFNRLGSPIDEADIEKERNPQTQQNSWGIPAEFLSGHAWHTYTLNSADKTVKFEFTHNVNGRDVYALGTLDAAIFLQAKVAAGVKSQAFSMIDVLKGV
jgi:4-hydroxy-tetrahydrodipicolinate reductase